MARRLPLLMSMLLASSAVLADGYRGDLGLGVYTHEGIYHGESAQTDVLPYIYGEWGSFFGRVDTFGYRLMPLARGHLEIGTLIYQDEMDSDRLRDAGVRARKNSMLLGLSTLQVTPLGAFSIALMQDAGKSKGQLAIASWIGEIKPNDWLAIYPEIGIELMSSKYADYYFGTEAGEGGYQAYAPGLATNTYFALHAAMPLGEQWNLAFTVRNKAFDTAISDSPIVGRSGRWNAFVALAYTFK